jgi:imidazoleglycerol-phosphate dehydratase
VRWRRGAGGARWQAQLGEELCKAVDGGLVSPHRRRPHLSYGLTIPAQRIGTYDTELVKEFFVAVVNNSGLTLHIRQLDGVNSHHIVEACFKAFARALRLAVEIDPRRAGAVPSSKGVLEQAGGWG